MAEEFKDIIAGLGQRISLYKSKLHDLQKKRDKAEDEIRTVKRYLELAETLYRVEIEKAKAATARSSSEWSEDLENAKSESQDIILLEKTKFSGLSIPQGAFLLLKEAGTPLHAKEMYQKLIDGGVRIRSKTPATAIAVSLSRDKRFKRVAPNTFELCDASFDKKEGQGLISEAHIDNERG
jgi:hypothetical protein